MKIPLAEHFHSVQGEGYWTGTPMHFIRLPGCSVGKRVVRYPTHNEYIPGQVTLHEVAPTLPTGAPAWECETWDGRKFWCDTDFNKHEEVFLNDLLHETWEQDICITGGEPLIHKPILHEFLCKFKGRVHLETSGTIDFCELMKGEGAYLWTTVSPKVGYLPICLQEANEIKLLVDGKENWDTPLVEQLSHMNKMIYVSPINDVDQINKPNLNHALTLLREHPGWKLSVQLHKYLGVR